MCRKAILPPRLKAILQAFLVTLIWSSSWVLIKIGLQDIPAVTFSSLRYFLAFLVLLPIYLYSPNATRLSNLSRKDWMVLVVYGFLYYTFAQTTQFIGLIYLNAITFSFILNFSAIVIVFLGWFFLAEKLTKIQWLGVALHILGVAFYFYPFENPSGTLIGYLIAVFHTLANSSGTVIGRYINRSRHLHPLTVSMVSMGIGSTLIFIWALIVDGIPHLSLTSWGIVIWMAIVNTALAFTLWNQTQRTLTATETGIINNLMLIHIVFLAWIFLGERITLIEGIGLVVVVFAIILVQLRNGVISYVEDRC